MRIALDIDSTLHHYWDVLSEVSRARFGIELPYDEQLTWGITRLRPEQLAVCVRESHSDARIRAGAPYPGAVAAVRVWHTRGHTVHVVSSREHDCYTATSAWLEAIGVPFDGLHCGPEKRSCLAQLEVDLLIDDNPLELVAAVERGVLAATIVHPWNSELCEEEDVIAAADWHELARLLEPLLTAGERSAA